MKAAIRNMSPFIILRDISRHSIVAIDPISVRFALNLSHFLNIYANMPTYIPDNGLINAR